LQKQQTLVSLHKHSVDKYSKLQTGPACNPLAVAGGNESSRNQTKKRKDSDTPSATKNAKTYFNLSKPKRLPDSKLQLGIRGYVSSKRKSA
jgi:hypothetical protein